MSTGHDDIAGAIVAGQRQVIGALAITLARSVPGIEVDDDGTTRAPGGTPALDGLISAYSSITGQLGVRLCHAHAKDALARHPEIVVPSFAALT